MLKKIVSGGQVGAEQAALDAAIKLDFPHGGWIQKGRKTKSGRLPDKYRLEEMSVPGYKDRIERNVVESDGTVAFSHGNLTGGADYSMKMAEMHGRPGLHVDLTKIPAVMAPSRINSWAIQNRIEVLNVSGSRASEDPAVFQKTRSIIEDVILLSLMEAESGEKLADYDRKALLDKLPLSPETVEEAVDLLISDLDLKDRARLSNSALDDLLGWNAELPDCVGKHFKLWSGNTELLVSCRAVSSENVFRDDDVRKVVIRGLWKKLRETRLLRVVA